MNKQDLKSKIEKLEKGIASKVTPENLKASLKSQKEKFEKELSDLEKKEKSDLSKKIKDLKSSVGSKNTKSSLSRDGARKAKKSGKRVAADGSIYYEKRANRTDSQTKKKPYLEKGGYMAEGGQVGEETIHLKSYNIHGQEINSGNVIVNYSDSTIKLPFGKTYKVENDREYAIKVLKTKIKASGGIKGLSEFLKEMNEKDSPFNPSLTNQFINGFDKYAEGGIMGKGGELEGMHAQIYRSDYDSPTNKLYGKKTVTIVDSEVPKIFEADSNAPAVRLVRRNIGFGKNEYNYVHAVPVGVDEHRAMMGGTFIYSSDSRFPNKFPIPLHDRVESYEDGGEIDMESKEWKQRMIKNHKETVKHYENLLARAEKIGQSDWDIEQLKKNISFHKNMLNEYKNEKMAKGGKITFYDKETSYKLGRPSSYIQKDVISKVTTDEEDFAGNFGWESSKGKLSEGYLYKLDKSDKDFVSEVKLKDGEKIFRYITYTTAVGGMKPLIKINIDKGLLYFLVDSNKEDAKFETVGVKALWVNLITEKMAKGGDLYDDMDEDIEFANKKAKALSKSLMELGFNVIELTEADYDADANISLSDKVNVNVSLDGELSVVVDEGDGKFLFMDCGKSYATVLQKLKGLEDKGLLERITMKNIKLTLSDKDSYDYTYTQDGTKNSITFGFGKEPFQFEVKKISKPLERYKQFILDAFVIQGIKQHEYKGGFAEAIKHLDTKVVYEQDSMEKGGALSNEEYDKLNRDYNKFAALYEDAVGEEKKEYEKELERLSNEIHKVERGYEKGGYVAVSEKDGYWYIMSKPTTKESAQELIKLGVPRGEEGKVVTLEEAKAHKKVIGAEYLEQGGYMAKGGEVDFDKVKTKYATQDVNLLQKEGSMAITDTKKGVIFGEHKEGFFTFTNRNGDKLFSGNKQEAIEFVKDNYEVEGMAKGGYMAQGGELNLGIRKMAQEEGFTPKQLGREYEVTMAQAVVEALTDANYHDAARKLVSLLEKNPKIAVKPDYPSVKDPKFKQKMAEIEKEYGSKYWDADEKTRNFAIKVSQKSGWDGYVIAGAFEYLVRVDGGYHKLADNIEKAMESTDSMAKGGEISTRELNKKIKDWYIKNYPTDDLGEEINDTITFKSFWGYTSQGYDVYEVLGVGDSVVRERVEEKLSQILGKEKMAKGGEVNKHTYMMLSRLQSDNDYYLGYGNRSPKNLWAGNVDDQIAEMKKLWNQLPQDGKPEWLSMEDIEEYERKMKSGSLGYRTDMQPHFTGTDRYYVVTNNGTKQEFTSRKEFNDYTQSLDTKGYERMAKGGEVGDSVKFKSGMGYWDVTKYPYGGDFKRLQGGEEGVIIAGTRKKGEEIRVKLNDGRTILVPYQAVDLPMEEKEELLERNKHLFTFGYEDGGSVGQNIEVFGYTTENFDICPLAIEEFEKAAEFISASDSDTKKLALSRAAMYVDDVFGVEKRAQKDNLVSKNEFEYAVNQSLVASAYNYASGLEVNLSKFIPMHISNIASKLVQVSENNHKDHISAYDVLMVRDTVGEAAFKNMTPEERVNMAKQSKFEEGGSIEGGNAQMVMSQAKSINHHAKELMATLTPETPIMAWVVAKMERAASDISDVAHYVDGLTQAYIDEELDYSFAKGGEVKYKDVDGIERTINFFVEGNKLMYFEPILDRNEIAAYINDSSKVVSPAGSYVLPNPIAKATIKWSRKNGYTFIQDDKEYAEGGELSNGVYYLGKPRKEGIVWAQKVVEIDNDGIYFATDYARKIKDFSATNKEKLSYEDFQKFLKEDARGKNISDKVDMWYHYASGGMITGRWYKDNSGKEFRYIGEDSTGNSLFSDGEKVSSKSLEDFETKTKESKLFGFFEEGGELKEEFLEDVEELHKEIAEITLVDGSKISHEELMAAHKMAKGGKVEGTYVVLSAVPNVDYEDIDYRGEVSIKPINKKVNSVEEAQQEVRKFIEKHELGGGNWPNGEVFKDGKKIGYISYNGRFWPNENKMGSGGFTSSFSGTPDRRRVTKEKGGYMAKGGGIYSSDSLYYLQVLKDGEEVGREKFRAKSLKEAREIAEDDYEKDYQAKFGDHLSFIVSEAMAEGGKVGGRGWDNYEKGKRITNISELKVGETYLSYDKQFNAKNIIRITSEDKTPLKRDIVYGGFVRNKNDKKVEGDFAIWGYELKDLEIYEIKDKMVKGGKVKFEDKVKAIKASLLKTKKVPKKVQKDYGKTYNAKEAEQAAKRIAGAMRKKEMK